MYDVPDIVAPRAKITDVGSSTPMGAAGYGYEPKRMRRGPPPKLPYKRDKLVISQSVSLWLLSCQHFPSFLSHDLCPGYAYASPPPGPTIKFICLIYASTLLCRTIAGSLPWSLFPGPFWGGVYPSPVTGLAQSPVLGVDQRVTTVLPGGYPNLGQGTHGTGQWGTPCTGQAVLPHPLHINRMVRRGGRYASCVYTRGLSCYIYLNFFVSVTFPFILVHNLLNMPAGVVPVTHVHQDDLNALSDLDDNDLGVKEIKQVCFFVKLPT